MIKDLSKSLIAAVAEIGKKSQEAYFAEQKALLEKSSTVKKMAMMKPAEPKAEVPAVAGAADMAKKNMKEAAGGSTPRTEKEKKLAAMTHPKDKITHGDVLHGRGVRKEGFADMMADVKKRQEKDTEEKGTGRFDKKRISTGTVYTRKASTFDDGGKSADMKKAEKKMKSEEAGQIVEYFDKVHIGSTKNYHVHSVNPEDGHYTATHKETGKVHDINIEDEYPHNTHTTVHGDVKSDLKGTEARGESSEIAKHIFKHISYGQKDYRRQHPDIKKEEADTPGNSYQHQCAIHVKHSKLGEGKTLHSQHADPDADGNIAWYDVMFEHGIEKKVPTAELEVTLSESHMNHKKAKK